MDVYQFLAVLILIVIIAPVTNQSEDNWLTKGHFISDSECLSFDTCDDNGPIGWSCPKKSNQQNVYKGCRHTFGVLFNAGGGQSCLEQDHKYNIFADVNNFTASVSTSAVNNSKYCCLTNIEFTVTDVDTYTIDVLAAQIFPPNTLFRCICEDYSLIVHEPLPVQDIDSRTIYNNVFLYWNGTHGYTYNVSIPELDIFNRSTDIEEISFNLKDEGIQANTSYTVVVESIVCGTPGNASSAVITIAMEPQISNEVTYGGYSFINNSYVSGKLMTKVSFPDFPASYPNNVMLNLTCNNNNTQEVLLLVLPVLVLEDGSVTVEFEIPRQRCDGYLSWQNKSPKQFDQLIAIEISDREEISNPAGGDSEISFSYFLTCCFISEKTLVEHEVCQLYNQTFSGSIVTIQAVHKCDGNYYVVCLDFDIHSNPTSPSTSIITSTVTSTCSSSSSLTTSSTTSTTSSTSSSTPEPTNELHGEICLNKPAFINMIIGFVLLWIIGIVTAIGISIKFEKIKTRLYDCIKYMRRQSPNSNLPESAVDPSNPNPVRVISANLSGVTQSITVPINVERSYYDTMSHSEQSALNTNQTQSVVNDGRSDHNLPSQGSSQPLLPHPRQHASASVI